MKFAGSDHAQKYAVAVCLDAVAAVDFQFAGYDKVHGYFRMALVGEHEAHLHVASALGQAGDGIEAGLTAAQGVHGDLGSSACGVENGGHDVGNFVGVDDDVRSELARHGQFVVLDICRDDPGSHRRGDHDGGEADSSAAVDGNPFSCPDFCLGFQGAKGCRKAAAQARGGHGIHGIGKPHQVHVGVVNGHEFGKGTPACESGLKLVVTDLLVAGEAGHAVPASGHEGHGHSVAVFPVPYVFPYLDDCSGQFVPGHVREPDVRVVPLPAMPVAPADACGIHGQNDAVIGGCGVGDVRDSQGGAELGKYGGFHGIFFLKVL